MLVFFIHIDENTTSRTINIPGIDFQAGTCMILTKESIKKLKPFPEFPKAGSLNEVLQATRFI